MDKNNNPQQPRNKKNTFSTIFLPLLLVVGMCLTFYFVFVKPLIQEVLVREVHLQEIQRTIHKQIWF